MPASRLVGEAYVLMRADGRLLKRDMKKAGGEAGEASGADWRKAFDAEVDQSAKTMQTRFRKALSDAFVGGDFSQFRKEFGSVEATVDGLRAKLKGMTFGPDGKALPLKDRQLLAKTYSEIVASLEAWGDAETEVERKQRESVGTTKRLTQLFKEQGAALSVLSTNREKAAKAADDKKLADSTKRLTQFFKDQNATLKVLSANRVQQEKILEKAVLDQDRAYRTYADNVEWSNTRITRSLREQGLAWENQGKKIDSAGKAVERHASQWVQGARSIRIGLDDTAERVDHFSQLVGRGFGKGSRNNFLNWVGSMVGGMLRLGNAVLTFPAKAIAHVVDSFGSAFTEARKTLGFFSSVGKGIGAVFGGGTGVVGLIGGAVAGFFALTKVLPSVISLMTLVAGAATALVGSIGIGLTGALLGLTPAALGAVAGLGTVFGVINSFAQDKENKQFWQNIFENPFKKFSKQFYPQIRTFLTTISGGFKRLLVDLTPSVNSFFSSFQKAFSDPASQAALDKWSTSLGKIATSVNNAVVSFGDGFIGFFAPVLPYAERFANYIERIAGEFAEWANSKPGQNAISDFMKAAWKDAKLVWDILGQIGGIFATVFSSGDEAGNTFLTGIRDKLKEINDFLKTPEGRSKLDAFFGDAKDIGTAIGDIAVDIGTLVKDLSSPEGRQGAKDILGSIKGIADSVGPILEVTKAVTNMLTKIQEFIDKVNPLANPLKSIFEFGGKLLGKSEEFESKPKAPELPSGPAPNLGLGGSTRPTPTAPAVPGITEQGKKVQQWYDDMKKKAAEGFKFTATVGVDDKEWAVLSKAIQDYVFYKKTIPVQGNDDLWNATKGTVAAYVFDPKTVIVKTKVDEAQLQRAKDKIRSWLSGISVSVRPRVAGINGQGGITFDDSASGRIVNGPNYGWTGEAGPEAIVPLNRPLNMVDPSVRELSAIAQGMKRPPMATQMASGGIAGAGGAQVVFEAGAVTTAAQNPAIVASMIKDDLVLALS